MTLNTMKIGLKMLPIGCIMISLLLPSCSEDYITAESVFVNSAQQFNADDFSIVSQHDALLLILNNTGAVEFSPITESAYYLVPDEVINVFNECYREYTGHYISNVYDCDDFSMDYYAQFSKFTANIPNAKHSFAIGIVTGRFDWTNAKHQANIILNGECKMLLVEPQSATMHKHNDNNNYEYIYF